MRIFAALTLCAVGAVACATHPPPPVVTPTPPAASVQQPTLTFEQKQSIILRLEEQRVLSDPKAASAAEQIAGYPAAAAQLPDALQSLSPRTLVDFITDGDPRIRRRSALAIGRAGVPDGVPALIARMTDEDPEVRQMTAFALGLLRDERSRGPLLSALGDAIPLVQGSAAQALGLLGDATAADAIAAMARRMLESGALKVLPDDRDDRRDTPPDAFRLALGALVELKAFPALASVVLDPSGQPRLTWWPVAFALARLEDPRAATALLTLAADPQPYTRAFAIKGLGALKEARAVEMLVPLVGGPDRFVAIEAMRALGRIGSPKASEALIKIIELGTADLSRRTEAITALGGVGGPGVPDLLLDLLGDRNPVVRAAAIRAYGRMDAEGFITILSALDADQHWSVRAALATTLGDMAGGVGLPRLKLMVQDSDQRVVPSVVAALAKINGPGVSALLFDRLKADDPTVRAAAAEAIGRLKLEGGPAALRDAYRTGLDRDVAYVARGAALAAIAAYGATEAVPLLTAALSDPEWPVRARAAALLHGLSAAGGAGDADARIRPAPAARGVERYDLARLVSPAVSPIAYLDTDKGTVQIELAVLDAPLTVENFMTLARSGFYDGVAFHRVVPNFVVQTGDPRGDGDGGPGYTIRDELNERSYMRGTVGMALDWADTGGSQFFITHSPQPHLDARYTIFGRVVDGMEVVDRLEQGDVLRKVRVLDGETR